MKSHRSAATTAPNKVATDREFLDYIVEQAALGDALTFKRMFGEYALYVDDKVVAFVCDNSLFVKAAEGTRHLTQDLPQRPPYPSAKDYPVADELLDDGDALRTLLLATERALPAAKLKKPKAPKPERAAKTTAKPITKPKAKPKAKPSS